MMRRICAMVALLILPAVLSAQEDGPRSTLLYVVSPTATLPGTVLTGQKFDVSYEIHFMCEVDQGFVELREDMLQPDMLSHDPITVHTSELEKNPCENNEAVWYLRLQASIVHKLKSDPQQGIAYAVPAYDIPWLIRPRSEMAVELEEYHFTTDEVPFTYVSSIAQNAERLDIMDTESFSGYPYVRYLRLGFGLGGALLLLLAAMAALVGWRKRTDVAVVALADNAERSYDTEVRYPRTRLVSQLRLRSTVKQVLDAWAGHDTEAVRQLQRKLQRDIRMLLASHLSGDLLNATVPEMRAVLADMRNGQRTYVLSSLITMLSAYEHANDSDRLLIPVDGRAHAALMLARELRGYRLAWHWLKRLVRKT